MRRPRPSGSAAERAAGRGAASVSSLDGNRCPGEHRRSGSLPLGQTPVPALAQALARACGLVGVELAAHAQRALGELCPPAVDASDQRLAMAAASEGLAMRG